MRLRTAYLISLVLVASGLVLWWLGVLFPPNPSCNYPAGVEPAPCITSPSILLVIGPLVSVTGLFVGGFAYLARKTREWDQATGEFTVRRRSPSEGPRPPTIGESGVAFLSGTVGILVGLLVVLATVQVTSTHEFSDWFRSQGSLANDCAWTQSSAGVGISLGLAPGSLVTFRWNTSSSTVAGVVFVVDPSNATIYYANSTSGSGAFVSGGGYYGIGLRLCEAGSMSFWGNLTTAQPLM